MKVVSYGRRLWLADKPLNMERGMQDSSPVFGRGRIGM